MVTNTLDWKDGYLAVRVDDQYWNDREHQPVHAVFWYPVLSVSRGRAEQDWGPLGVALTAEGDGAYSGPSDSRGRRMRYRLERAGRTTALAHMVTPIEPPSDNGKVIRTRKKRLPFRRAPFERIEYAWDRVSGQWVQQRELLSEAEAEKLGLDW